MANNQPFISKDTANEAYTESKNWLRLYFEPLDEFERIARNKPSPKIDPSLPRITDGTMAAIVQETPRRVIQQLATGQITSRDHPDLAAIADVVHRHRLLPLYNRMGTALQKHWNMLSAAMTYGSAASYTFFTTTDGQLHTDFIIPYRKDVLTEKGKVYGPDSNVIFMRSWYQKRDLKAIINREQAMMKNDKKYTPEWDLKLLAEFMEAGSSAKPAEQLTPAEREKGGDNGGYEVIHCFQRGQGAEFYSFAPRFKDGAALRIKVNSDPRGKMPIDFEYCNIDLSNPLGRGQVELSGGVQNLIDQQMQMYQFMSTLEMSPPLQVYGNVDKTRLKMRPGAIWDMGQGQNNDVKPYAPSNYSLQNFGNNYGLLKSQILNLNNSQDTSVSSQSGNPGFSKTDAGVKNQSMRLGISDNYLEKQHEAWYAAQSETSINIFFAEMKGKEQIELGKQDIELLKKSYAFNLVKDDQLHVNYSDISGVTFNFKTDASSSQEADDLDQLQRIQEVIKEVGESGPVLSYYLAQVGKKLNVGELYQQQFERMGLKNIDQILADMDEQEAEQAKQQPFPIIDKPQIRINSADLSPSALTAALAAGGVNIQPAPDAVSSASAQAQLDYQVEMAKAQAAAQAKQGQPQGMDPNELALKQQEMALKQQAADDTSTKTALEIAKTAHQHTLDMHNAVQAQQQQQVDNQNTQQQMQQQAAQAQQQAQSDGQSPSSSPKQSQTQEQSPVDQAYDQAANLPEDGPQDQSQDQGPAVALDGQLSDQENQLVEVLVHRGFSEQDIEQAIVMLRHGMPIQQALATLGAKQ